MGYRLTLTPVNTDTKRPDDPDLDDLDGLAASLDHLRLWRESEGTGDRSGEQLLSARSRAA
jgi:hypothetical protein